MERATWQDYVVAFIVGLGALGAVSVSITLLVRAEGLRFWNSLLPLSTGGTTELLAWMVYSVHFVGTTGPNNLAFGSNTVIFRLLSTGVPLFLYYSVPPIILVIAGYQVVQRSSTEFTRMRLLTVSGALGAGYGLLPLIGSFVIKLQLERDLLMTPDPGYTVLLMGIGYPLIFGSLGGILASDN